MMGALDSLFRPEALDFQRRRLWGNVVVLQPVSFMAITLVLLVATAAVGVYLYHGTYARKETVSGYLAPARGLIIATAQRGGTIVAVHVEEGDDVDAGEPLVTIRLDDALHDGARSYDRLSEQLDAQREEIDRQLRLREQQHGAALAATADELRGLELEQQQLRTALAIQEERAEIAGQQSEALVPALEQGFVSKREAQIRQQEHLALRNAVQDTKQRLAAIGRRLEEARSQLARLPLQYAEEVSILRGRLSDIEVRRTENERSNFHVLTAATTATVTGMQAVVGQTATPAIPLVTLRGVEDPLMAQLLVPTRARGFIRPGQAVRLMYDAFPYQRFGMHAGRIVRVTNSVYAPGEALGPLQLEEPAYRAVVELDRQFVAAFGERLALQPGMLLTADVVLDERKLTDLLLDPIRAVGERL